MIEIHRAGTLLEPEGSGCGMETPRAQLPVIEFWIENRLMCELLPPEFASEYLRVATRGPKPKDVE